MDGLTGELFERVLPELHRYLLEAVGHPFGGKGPHPGNCDGTLALTVGWLRPVFPQEADALLWLIVERGAACDCAVIQGLWPEVRRLNAATEQCTPRPLAAAALKGLEAELDEYISLQSYEGEVGTAGCDHSLRRTRAWFWRHDPGQVENHTRWLRGRGGYCDCEVVMNLLLNSKVREEA